MRKPGDYKVRIKTKNFKYTCKVHVEDTIAPVAEGVSVETHLYESVEAKELVQVADATPVTVTYVQEPDYTRDGEQSVTVLVTDLGGNSVQVTSTLTVISVREELQVEAGSEPVELEDFLLGETDAAILTDLTEVDYTDVGETEVEIRVGDHTYVSTLRIVDTVAPVFEVHEGNGFLHCEVAPELFVSDVEDVTEVTFSFTGEPDIDYVGEQEVEIVGTDEGGNRVVKKTTITLIEDTEPPVLSGVKDKSIYLGHSISYREGVTVTDNNPLGTNLEIDTGGLDINVAGTYKITYTVTDAAGNTTVETAKVTVLNKTYTEEQVWEYCDKALKKIRKADMSEEELAWAIYRYIRRNVVYYSGHSTKIDWIQGAVDGFADRTGDCFIYASMAKALLTRAGIENIDVIRNEEGIDERGGVHYWSFVNVDGKGWTFYDVCPNIEKTKCFLWTKSEAAEYTERHPGYYCFDEEGYPEINP